MPGSNWTLGILAGDVATAGDRGLVAAAGFARLMAEIRVRVPRCILSCPVTGTGADDRQTPLHWPVSDLIALPPMVSTVRAQRHAIAAWSAIRELVRKSDVLLVRWPFQLPFHLLALGKPNVLHVVADTAEVVRASRQRGWIAAVAARAFARLMEAIARRIAHEPRTRVVTNGTPLLRLLRAEGRGRAVVSSTLLAAEVPPLQHRPLHAPARLLFVGHARPEKGIDLLLEAMRQLSASRRVMLTIAGGNDRAGAHSVLDGVGLPDNVAVAGPVPYGEPLFRLFREHDVCVLPSRSEGTPRVLIEARAFSCPVVATAVGGVPDSVTHEETGLLAPPENSALLAAAIVRLLDDAPLRARLVEGGHTFALKWTLEAYADVIVNEITAVREGTR